MQVEEVKSLHVALSEVEIKRTVRMQAQNLAAIYKRRDIHQIEVLPVWNGCMFYVVDLMRELNRYTDLKMRVVPPYDSDIDPRIKPNENVLVVDTIYDTGRQANQLQNELLSLTPGPHIRFSFLVRKSRVPIVTHDFAVMLPELWVYGYGLDDSQGLNRELPYITYESADSER